MASPRESVAPSLALPGDWRRWGEFYRRHLLEDIVPFWMRHGVDREQGGIWNVLADDGALRSTDKYLWSQARALWTFSALYRRIERRAEWLEIARSLFDFCRRCGPDENGHWRLRVTRDGQPLEGPLAIVVDCFAIMGLVEFARASGSSEAAALARATYASVVERLAGGRFGTLPYPLPAGMKAHRYSMQCSLAFHELGTLLGDAAIIAEGRAHTAQIMNQYVRPEHRALVEYVDLAGNFSDTPAGRAVVPGHGIESMWFQLQIWREAGERGETARALDVLDWTLVRGWDDEFGGLLLARDLFGKEPPFWAHATAKLWWPATEAMCATLLAYEADRDPKWLQHHRRIVEWALAHFPDRVHGEWVQRLDRIGRPLHEVVALPVKDFFHLPRALIVSIEALDRLGGRTP